MYEEFRKKVKSKRMGKKQELMVFGNLIGKYCLKSYARHNMENYNQLYGEKIGLQPI